MEWWDWVLLFVFLFFYGWFWERYYDYDPEATKREIMRLTDEEFTKEYNRYREEALRRMK